MIERRKITKEMYERAKKWHGGSLDDSDMEKVFTERERNGLGVYNVTAYEKYGNYFVRFELGKSCD